MFYDLEKPIEFVRDVHEILADDGIWVFEQSYMPSMLEVNAFDTICHEHLEYYRLKQIQWMMKKVGFKIIDIDLNQSNGEVSPSLWQNQVLQFRNHRMLPDYYLKRKRKV